LEIAMHRTLLASVSLVLVSALAACASPAESGSSAEDAVTSGAAVVVAGEFAVRPIGVTQAPGCDVFTFLKIERTAEGGTATLENRVAGVCPVIVAADPRKFAVRAEAGTCGTRVYRSITELPPTDVNRAIEITDFRDTTCIDVNGTLSITETRGTVKTQSIGVAFVAPTSSVTPGTFALRGVEAPGLPSGCDRFTFLKLETSAEGNFAFLEERAIGACPTTAPDPRRFALRVAAGSCGTKIYHAITELPPTDLNRTIEITDFRAATCVDVAAPISTREVRGSVETEQLGLPLPE
jgi:hypothetical protein